jgi:hypothetical protein
VEIGGKESDPPTLVRPLPLLIAAPTFLESHPQLGKNIHSFWLAGRSRSEHLDPWLDSHIQNTVVIRRTSPDSDAALMRWQQKHANSRRRMAGEQKRAK